MNAVVVFMGELLCKMPLGVDGCHSTPGKASLGGWTMIAFMGVTALYILMRNPQR
ncbi:hypothetical protein SAMN05444161_4093 [Rhizobiales bacterium GAS191]|nr:hypothetical protein SAMN05519103_03386 [Rhizobiales bacterium GAS113]SED81729.1 hypothetical protein SAMN05444161_4093 [Rhizobiales bacterium GAS191]